MPEVDPRTIRPRTFKRGDRVHSPTEAGLARDGIVLGEYGNWIYVSWPYRPELPGKYLASELEHTEAPE